MFDATGARIIGDQELVYDRMSGWHDKQFFLFKAKDSRDASTGADASTGPVDGNGTRRKNNPVKRAAKLAGFFGISEMDLMLTALNSMHQHGHDKLPGLEARVSIWRRVRRHTHELTLVMRCDVGGASRSNSTRRLVTSTRYGFGKSTVGHGMVLH